MIDENAMYSVTSVHNLSWDTAIENVRARDFYALSFRLVGNTVFSSDSTSFTAGTGDVLYVPKGIDYTVNHKREHIIAIHFDCDTHDSSPWVHNAVGSSIFSDLFIRADIVWKQKKSGYRFELNSILSEILTHLEIQNTDRRFSGTSESFRRSVDYMQSHFCDPSLNVDKLCSIAGMSDTYFRSLFDKQFHTAPAGYITSLRLNYAKELLKSGYYSVTQISEMCGFECSKYFSTVFKKHEGIPPTQFLSKKEGP